jgi:hypothetical protein
MNFPEPTRHTGAAVCGTAAHLWLQQLPFVVVQMQWLPALSVAQLQRAN